MTSVIGTKFSLSSFYGNEEKQQMMYKMRLKVLNKSQGVKKAAKTAIRRGQVKMSLKYNELKTLDSFYDATPPVKVKEKKTKRSIEAKDPRPSRKASAAASEKLTSSAAFSYDDIEDARPDRPMSVKLRKRTFKEVQESWSSDDDDDNWIPRSSKGTMAKKRTVPEPPPPEPVLSEYEKSAQEKIAQRQKFLEELGILQMKREMQKLPKPAKTQPQKREYRQSTCNSVETIRDEPTLPASELEEQTGDESDTTQPSTSIKVEDSLTHACPTAAEGGEATEMERCSPSVGSQDSEAGTSDSTSNQPVVPSVQRAPRRKSPKGMKQARASNPLPKVLKTLRSTAAKAAGQAKAKRGLPHTLKQNLDELVKPGARPRRVLNTLANTKQRIRRKLA